MSTAAVIPHKKLAGMRVPVVQAGRWNLQASEVNYKSNKKTVISRITDLNPTLYHKEISKRQNHVNVHLISLSCFEPGISSSHRS